MPTKRHIAAMMELNQPYKRHHEIFAGIQDYAEHHADWSFDVGNYPEFRLADGERVDGVIGRISEECLVAAQDAGVPMVNVWHNSPVAAEVPGVYTDFYAVGRIAAEHLIARGVRRFAHFGYARDVASKLHYQGMHETAHEHGCSCVRRQVSVYFDEGRDQWDRFIKYVKKSQAGWAAPIGVGFMDDVLCRSVVSACLMMGWSVPEEMTCVGAGNNEIICNVIDPTLSSVDVGCQQCGYEAARLLDRLIQGHKPPAEAVYTPPKGLVVRRSSDAFAVSDQKVSQALRHMADHAGDNLSVPSIAQAVGLGRQALERRFRRHVGHAVNEELIRIRVETLKRLLVESDAPIKTLSARAGFGAMVNMYTMFKRHTGMTPAAYRKKHGPQPERDERGT